MIRTPLIWIVVGGLGACIPAIAIDENVPDAQPPWAAPAATLPDFGRTAWHATKYVASSPTEWDSDDWLKLGGATALIVGTGLLLDEPLRDAARRNHGNGFSRFARDVEPLGYEYSVGVLGAFYVTGVATHNPRAKLVAEDGLIASALSGGATLLIKEMVGRSRPSSGQGADHFTPFRGRASFPSSHATQAFTVASVIAAHYGDDPWIDAAVYGVATMVCVARVDRDEHFASDVLAGALIGHVIGRAVVNSRLSSAEHVRWTPMAAPGFAGLVVEVDF